MRFYALKLSALIAIVFIFQYFYPLAENFSLVSGEVLQKPWLLITSIFLHADAKHLLSNLFALGLFGSLLEKFLGGRKFVEIFFIAGIASGISSSFFYSASLGASGAIYGIIGALAAIKPRMTVWAFGVPMPMFVAAFAWLLLDFAGMFYPSGIANAAHIAGLLCGIALGFPSWEKTKKTGNEIVISREEFDRWERKYMRIR